MIIIIDACVGVSEVRRGRRAARRGGGSCSSYRRIDGRARITGWLHRGACAVKPAERRQPFLALSIN